MVGRTPWSAAGPLAGLLELSTDLRRAGAGGRARTRGAAAPVIPAIYPILDTEAMAARNFPLLEAAEAWIEGGAGIIQLRHKGHWGRTLFDEARALADLCRARGVIFIVDDRADLAALLHCGLHVGQDDLSPADARTIIGPDAVLGFSSHNADQLCAAAAEPVSYVAFGPCFPTRSKRNPDPVLGLAELRRCRGLTAKPLVAIGGITRENAGAIFAAGADAVAVIADMLPEDCSNRSLRERMEEWQQLVRK
jgi:thiamine-phosphate pyrophosphorylase